MTKNKQLLTLISELQAISQSGLTFSKNPFDIERYIKIRELSAELAAYFTTHSAEKIKHIFSLEQGYATPKLDVRSFALKEGKLLLVRERQDDLWALPGGFIDVGESPSEAAIRETKEESGLDVSVVKLLAFWDKFKHGNSLQWPHIYKCIFHCEIVSGEAKENLEISEVDFFDMDHLPPLSLPRITPKQVHALYKLLPVTKPTQFD